jgi:aldehyde dehydrogenase (NAD+)
VLDFFITAAEAYPFEESRNGVFGNRGTILREPVGVVAGITAWNGPLLQLMGKVAPALAAGCTVVLKPAPETPLSSMALAEAFERAGLPPGVLSILPAGREVGRYLVSHPGVNKVSFTGSPAAGREIGEICGASMKRVTLELGGKSAAIVLDDADAAMTSTFVSLGCMAYSGQACAALTRVLVPSARYGEFIAGLAHAIGRLQVGDPLDPATIVGPLVAERQLRRVEDYIATGIARAPASCWAVHARRNGPMAGMFSRPCSRMSTTGCGSPVRRYSGRFSARSPMTPRRTPSRWRTTILMGCRARCSAPISTVSSGSRAVYVPAASG